MTISLYLHTCTEKSREQEAINQQMLDYLNKGGTITGATNTNNSPHTLAYKKAQIQRDKNNAITANRNRSRIIEQLKNGETLISQISETLKLTPNCVLRHLMKLKEEERVSHVRYGIRSHWTWIEED